MNWFWIGVAVAILVIVLVAIVLLGDDAEARRQEIALIDRGLPQGLVHDALYDIDGMCVFGHLWHFDGTEWRSLLEAPPETEPVTGVALAPDETPWVCTFDSIYTLDEENRLGCVHTSPARLQDIWVGPDGQVFAVGGSGTILSGGAHGQFTREDVPAEMAQSGIFGVCSPAPGDIYASAAYGKVLHRDSSGQWNAEQTPSDSILVDIWSPGPNDVYAVSQDGEVFHSEGDGSWDIEPTPDAMLGAIGGTGPDDIYAVGGAGVILHSTGSGDWEKQPIDTQAQLMTVGSTDMGTVLVGDIGGSLHASAGDGTWTTISGEGRAQINAIAGTSSHNLYAGTETFYDLTSH